MTHTTLGNYADTEAHDSLVSKIDEAITSWWNSFEPFQQQSILLELSQLWNFINQLPTPIQGRFEALEDLIHHNRAYVSPAHL
jgi:hypothetical protein